MINQKLLTMKKLMLLITLSFLFYSFQAEAQVIVNGVNINEIEEVKICRVVARSVGFSNKVTITIDYGQDIKWANVRGTRVTRPDGTIEVFNSLIGALNYMENNGWEYRDMNFMVSEREMNTYQYYFKRKE